MGGKYVGDAAIISKIRHKKQSSAPSAPAANYALSYVDNSDIAHLLTSAAVNKYLLDSSVAYLSEQATPATPASGLGRIFFNTSGEFCAINDAGGVSVLSASSFIGFHAYSTTNQTPTLGVTTKLTWTTEDFDSNSWMDIATNHRFTPLQSGKYLIYGFCSLTKTGSTSAGTGFLELQKNGASVARAEANVAIGEVKAMLVSQVIDFNGSTDYIEVFANIAGSGSGQEITKSTRRGGFGGIKI